MKTAADYSEIFLAECTRSYAEVTALEASCGYAVNRAKLEAAARVLACPHKVNPPNWQHGRVIYALARELIAESTGAGVFLDIGTAKGFSAVVLSWAVSDGMVHRRIVSVDAVDPLARVPRNSVAEADGALWTVPEYVSRFAAPGAPIEFRGGGSDALLRECVANGTRVRFAFVDGKHSETAVAADAAHLAQLQRAGDLCVFDDLQIDGVRAALARVKAYSFTIVNAGPSRRYAVGVRL